MKKVFYFNIQAKGGTGKSTLTYLQALKHEENPSVVFVDLDSSNQSSTKQLRFLQPEITLPDEQTETSSKKKTAQPSVKSRIFTVDIYDHLKKIEREKMMDIIQAFSQMDYPAIYMDFGGSESEQFPTLFSLDFTIGEFKDFESYVNAKFVFNIVLAGGTAYAPCFEYALSLIKIIAGKFDIVFCINDMTFAGNPSNKRLLDEIQSVAENAKPNITVSHFGNFQTDRNSGQLISENIRTGKGLSGLTSYGAKTILKREIAKL